MLYKYVKFFKIKNKIDTQTYRFTLFNICKTFIIKRNFVALIN